MSTTYKIIITIFFVFLNTAVKSQTDSLKVFYSEEDKEQSDFKLRKSYPYLDIKMKDEDWLVKVAPKFQLVKRYGDLSLDIGIEKKVLTNFSLQVYNSSSLSIDQNTNTFSGNLSLEARYYPGLGARVSKGTSGNNLSGVYVGAGAAYLFEYTTDKLDNNDHTDYNIRRPFPYFVVGVQKRLNNWSFLEVYSITGYSKDAYYYSGFQFRRLYSTLGFRLGFAWGK